MITEKEDYLLVDIKVIPRSSLNKIDFNEDEIRLKITAPPVDGEANKAVVDYFSKMLGLTKKSIFIEKGHSSRNKTIKIAGISKLKFIEILKK